MVRSITVGMPSFRTPPSGFGISTRLTGDRVYFPLRAFALALELPLDQMQEMLGKAGFTLSRSSKFDIIVEYFVERRNYNVYEINEALFAFDQSLIGA